MSRHYAADHLNAAIPAAAGRGTGCSSRPAYLPVTATFGKQRVPCPNRTSVPARDRRLALLMALLVIIAPWLTALFLGGCTVQALHLHFGERYLPAGDPAATSRPSAASGEGEDDALAPAWIDQQAANLLGTQGDQR